MSDTLKIKSQTELDNLINGFIDSGKKLSEYLDNIKNLDIQGTNNSPLNIDNITYKKGGGV